MSDVQLAVIGGFGLGVVVVTFFYLTIKLLKKIFKRKPKKKSVVQATSFDIDLNTSELEKDLVGRTNANLNFVEKPLETGLQKTSDSEIVALIDGKAVKLKLNDVKLFGKRTFIEK